MERIIGATIVALPMLGLIYAVLRLGPLIRPGIPLTPRAADATSDMQAIPERRDAEIRAWRDEEREFRARLLAATERQAATLERLSARLDAALSGGS